MTRREAWSPAPPITERRWLSLYYWHLVQPLSKGALLGEQRGRNPSSRNGCPMIRSSDLKKRPREEPMFGCFVTFASLGVTEFLADLGFDFTLLDGEHAAMGSVAIEDMIRASQCRGRALDRPRPVQPGGAHPEGARQRC